MRDTPHAAAWWVRMENKVFADRPVRERPTKIVEHVDNPDIPMLPLGAEFLRQTIVPKPPRGDAQGQFRYDAPRYEDLLTLSQQPMLSFTDDELYGTAIDDIDDCVCNAA